MINLELLKPVMLGDHLQQYPFQILPGRLACFMGRSVTNGDMSGCCGCCQVEFHSPYAPCMVYITYIWVIW